jgi:hypothetical protein
MPDPNLVRQRTKATIHLYLTHELSIDFDDEKTRE